MDILGYVGGDVVGGYWKKC